MNLKNIAIIFGLIPVVAFGASRSNTARVGIGRSNAAGVANRLTTLSSLGSITAKKIPAASLVEQRTVASTGSTSGATSSSATTTTTTSSSDTSDSETTSCREAYQACMDEFCLLDETEGSRCACSDNINRSKSLIQEVQKIQAQADALFTEGVEFEKLGAKAKLLQFGESDKAKKRKVASGFDFAKWVSVDVSDEDDVGEDVDIGSGLYAMAQEACQAELDKCGTRAKAEENLYNREIIKDCKAFNSYLTDQKREAEMNKKTAESAVRTARAEMLNTTNKYNRGQCLLVFRSCVADQGGCGVNFENCLDSDLLDRRARACDDILDQCMAVRKDVEDDWVAEKDYILKEAEKYADKNKRATCLAKIQNCLEEGCSTSTETACLTDVNVAANICPVITECEEKVPGLQSAVNDKLKYLQTKFCENDVSACLKDKCGVDFTKPECVGKEPTFLASLCPQSMFPSCKNATQFQTIVNSIRLHMDYQLMTGCINQFAEKLTEVCGTDMACLPVEELLPNNIDKWVDLFTPAGASVLNAARTNATRAVDKFFEDFENDYTLNECEDVYGNGANRVDGRSSLKGSINQAAKLVAYTSARNRAIRELTSYLDELKVKEEMDRNQKYCVKKFQEEKRPADKGSYSYLSSVVYEPDLKNCHVCYTERVCETGGVSKGLAATSGALAGVSTLGSVGMGAGGVWGGVIGAALGGLGGGLAAGLSAGKEDSCQDLPPSCKDINVSGVTEEMLQEMDGYTPRE